MRPFRHTGDAVIRSLATDARSGLSQADALERLRRCGRNELPADAPVAEWRKFLAQFTGTLVILLLIAAAVSIAVWMHERGTALPYDASAIFAIVLLNAAMGYVQQTRAERALSALSQLSAPQAKVIRDSQRQIVPAAELVSGDIIVVEAGDSIPADARVLESTALQAAEAALTGESAPVSKKIAAVAQDVDVADQDNMIFSGTVVTYGHGKAVVTATGMQTQIGRIAGMLRQARDAPTPLQEQLDRVGKVLAIVVVGIAVVMIAAILVLEDVHGISAIIHVLIFGIALAVAAVPEGLPAIVTAALSLGVHRMAKRNAIVRRLAAVETLGSADVIASDKTGTLTRNEMVARLVVTSTGRVTFSGLGYSAEGELKREGGGSINGALRSELRCALTIAARASNAVLREHEGRWTVQGDPTEGALIAAARKAGLAAETLDGRFTRKCELPFSSTRKLMTTIDRDAEGEGRLFAFTKGAPEVLLARCGRELVGENQKPITADRRAEILKVNEELAGKGLRTLAVAFRSLPEDTVRAKQCDDVEIGLVFVGLIGLIDPPREEAKAAVARARGAGIRPILITGDHPRTAAVIATELGITPDMRVISGSELTQISDEELGRVVREISVYARVDPEHKLRIVKALQRNGKLVAMTGDGVNDAPALKTADIGIAMGITGTDVSKQAADMVLADDNFATIVTAVAEGRAIFANIRKFLRFLLSSNIGEVMTMFFGIGLASVIGLTPEHSGELSLPLLATQILWINLITDGAPALALAVEPPKARYMNRSPRPRSEAVITGSMWIGILWIGAVMTVGTLLVLDASLPGGLIEASNGNIRYAQTMAFTTLVLFQLFNALNARSDEASAFEALFSNRWLWAAITLSLLLHCAVLYIPFLQEAFSTTGLRGGDWLFCVAVASSVLWLGELTKVVARAKRKNRDSEDWLTVADR